MKLMCIFISSVELVSLNKTEAKDFVMSSAINIYKKRMVFGIYIIGFILFIKKKKIRANQCYLKTNKNKCVFIFILKIIADLLYRFKCIHEEVLCS